MITKERKTLILKEIKSHYKFDSDAKFADFLEISPQTLSSWYSRGTFDISALYSKCIGISASWLISGLGNMFDAPPTASNSPSENGIPLMNAKAAGSYNGSAFNLEPSQIKDWYSIPKYSKSDLSFLIEVQNNSMSPRYNCGDIVGCMILNNPNYIEFGRPHVIATRDRGILLKRLKKSDDPKNYTLVSDNSNYDPFDIPKEDILGIALVKCNVNFD